MTSSAFFCLASAAAKASAKASLRVALSSAASAQTAYTWALGGVDGAWNDENAWTPAPNQPRVAGDVRQREGLGWITTIGVTPAYRQQGIAVSLLKAVELELHMDRIRLSVRKNNTTAIQMYKKYGYVQVSQWPGYYEDREDALIFERNLPD